MLVPGPDGGRLQQPWALDVEQQPARPAAPREARLVHRASGPGRGGRANRACRGRTGSATPVCRQGDHGLFHRLRPPARGKVPTCYRRGLRAAPRRRADAMGAIGNEVGFYQSFAWRRASYRTMPAAVARLRLRTLPVGMGMPMVRATYRSRTVVGSPFDSLPNTRQSPSRNVARVYGTAAGVSTHQMWSAPTAASSSANVRVVTHLNRVPVIEPGPLEAAVVGPEPKATDEVQDGPGGGAQPGHVSGVRRDLGFPEREWNMVLHFNSARATS